jgi:hypothetical protein
MIGGIVLTPDTDARRPVGRIDPEPDNPPRAGIPVASVHAAMEWHNAVVRRRVVESPYSVALILDSPNGRKLPFEPGHYVWVSVRMPDNERHVLQYTLWSVRPGDSASTVTIALVGGDHDCPLAREASNFIHGHVFEGNIVDVGFPPTNLTPSAGARVAAEFATDPEHLNPQTAVWNRLLHTRDTAEPAVVAPPLLSDHP